ncbi:MAG TPA: TonB-dependent receptor [Rhodocyclaceae bacterium]|nr:TonB-dependent receptor [Rhodocyclaceae bacterium]
MLPTILIVVPQISLAQSGDDEDLAQVYGDKSVVLVATGNAQPIARAPSVATVITAADIEAMGARDIDEVLEQVPGLHVSRSFLDQNPIYTIRGIDTQFNPQVLILINGIPITSVFSGDRGNVWGGMPVGNIARIEVIRGPGSALYGADALTGVISIFTKTPTDTPGTKVSVGYGSFNTFDTSMRHAGTYGDIGFSLYMHTSHTSGQDSHINSDAQTSLDQVFGTNASHAPGPMSMGMHGVDTGLDMRYKSLTFRASYKKRDDVGDGTGVANALDPDGRSSTERYTADITWSEPQIAKDLSTTVQANFYNLHENSELNLFPPGAFGGAFPDGVIGDPEKWERHTGLSASASYVGLKDHRVGTGVGYIKEDLYRIHEERNYVLGALGPTPLGGLVDVSDTAPFLRPHSRIVRYGYLQDEWQLARDWALTAGVRHDDYSDVGGTTNPRAALVWDAAYNVTAKILYGRAFRPPSFTELYNINNPVATGNADVKPETIETTESAVLWQVSDKLQLGVNAYRFKMRDILRFVPNADPTTGNTAENAGSLRGDGMEVEATWDALSTLRLSGNLSLQHTYDPATGLDPGDAPKRHAYMRADWQFTQGWSLGPAIDWVSGRAREPGDTRPKIPDYTLVDLALRSNTLADHWTIALTIKNLFDTDAFEPSPAPGLIADDFPLPGRTAFLQGSYAF